MATRARRVHNCRIYHANQLQSFDPNQPFSTVGGYADLFRGYHVEDGELALKRPRWGTGDLTDRFDLATQEAGVWQVLRHPNILAFLGILYSKSHIYLVSPFASRGSLPQYLKADPDIDRTKFILHIAAGLAYLHSQNVIHGDVKGANVLVSEQLTAQLCDFGLSKFADATTSSGATGRSLPWLSPERMDHANSPRTKESDVYAFGMTIYEILSGFIPFHTLGVDDLVIAVCIRDERPPASPEFSTAGTSYMPLWRLAGMCWDKDPARRCSMGQAHDHIAPGDRVTFSNTESEDMPRLAVSPSSNAATLGRKENDSDLDAIDLVNGRQQFRGITFQTTEPAQNEGSSRVLEGPEPEAFNSPGSITCASLSSEELPPKDADTWLTIAVDNVEIGLRVISNTTSTLTSTAGSIVKIMAATGLAIIEILKNLEINWEHAMELCRHIGTLIQCAARFLESPVSGMAESCEPQTSAQLQLFLYSLKALEKTLAVVHGHGRYRQGISHQNIEDDLINWEATINRAFVALQIQLSLHSLRIVTHLGDAGARLERDRLLGRLGDGDIGATEKAFSAADLMCLPGTRTEALDQVNQWIADPSGSRIFWISGVAGCGKSALAATIAGRPRAIPTSIAIFYFVRGNQERNKRVLCSLSRQLGQFGYGSLERFVLSAVKARPDIATSHLDTQFQHIILDPLKQLVPGSPPVILVIDALDEWNDYEAATKLVKLIKQAHAELPPNVRFVLASRNEPHLVRMLDSPPMRPLVTRYPLDAVLKSDAGRDIQRYIEERFVTLCAETTIVVDETPWPEARDVDNLVMLSDGLFQWAATVMSYIGARRSQGRLREILQNPERYRGLDNLYQGVLVASSRVEMDERVPRLLQEVLGAILTAPVPINATTITYLCCDDVETLGEITEIILEEVLPNLASMFIIPKDPMQPITVSHKSVFDYLTNEDRCTDSRFHTNLIFHHARVFNTFNRLMERDLKRDICGINNPSKLNMEVQDQVEQKIPLGLRHLCRHWAAYLPGFDRSASTQPCRLLRNFTRTLLLHWLEVMSLIGLTKDVIPIARDVERWLSGCPSCSRDEITQRLWSDIQRFVVIFSDPISTAAAHIYISALRLAPTETQLARQFGGTVELGVRVTGGLLGEQWPPSTWTAGGHMGAVHYASFSPDGKKILSGSGDNTLRLWDASSGSQKGTALHGHTSVVRCASFSPDGETVVSGSFDNTLRLWDSESGAQKGATLEHHVGWVSCASFSPDGNTILSGSDDNTLRLWGTESGAQKCRTLQGHTGAVRCAMFSPDGKTILSGSDDNTLRLWDAESGAQKYGALQGHTGVVRCASFSPDGKTILSGSGDKTLRLWDVETGAQKGATLDDHAGWVRCASFSPDGRTILSGSFDQTLRLWEARSGARKGDALTGHASVVLCASFSPDGKTILSGSGDSSMRLWDVESGAQKGATLEGHAGWVSCASFSPDGKTILSGSHDKTLRLWDADAGALRAEPRNGHTRGVSCFMFSPDGEVVASGSYDETVRLWDAETGSLRAGPLSAEGAVSEISFSTDGLTLNVKTYGGLSHKWDLTTCPSFVSGTKRDPVFKGSVSPDGWIFHREIRWFWVPFSYADWMLCGSRLALRRERVVYIFDVSEIMYIVE